MCLTMKIWERVIEHRLRQNIKISEKQFGFILGRSTTEAIHLLRQLIKRFRERKRNLHMVFIDLGKAYDKVPREILWWTLMKKGAPIKYIDIIRDIYNGVVANVRICEGITNNFSIITRLYKGSTLSPLLFAILMDELTRVIQDEIP